MASRRGLPGGGQTEHLPSSRRYCPLRVKDWVRTLPHELHRTLIKSDRLRPTLLFQLLRRTQSLKLTREECDAAADWIEARRGDLLEDYSELMREQSAEFREYCSRVLSVAEDLDDGLKISGLRLDGSDSEDLEFT